MSQMTDERRGQIALAILEAKVLSEGLISPRKLGDEFRRAAQETGIDATELKDFYRSFVPRLYGRMFGFKSVEINATN